MQFWLAVVAVCFVDVTWGLGCCCDEDCTSNGPCPAAAAAATPSCPPPPPCPMASPQQIVGALCKPVKCPECPPAPACPQSEPCEVCPECPMAPSPQPCPECPPPPPPQPCTPTSCQQSGSCSRLPMTRNDCCQSCSDDSECFVNYRRKFRNRARYHKNARKNKRFSRYIRGITIDDDPTCNNHALRRLMYSNMTSDVSETKRVIQKLAETEFKQNFNVICSPGSFAYVVHSNIYCQASSNGIHCYAFSF